MELGRRSIFFRIVGHAQSNLTQTSPVHPGPTAPINSSPELLMLILGVLPRFKTLVTSLTLRRLPFK
eukprot:251710-Prymnesium_polylepis.1